MARLFQRWPVLPTRVHTELPDDGGSARPSPHPASRHHRAPRPLGRPRLRQRSQRLLANRAVRDAIVSLAGVVGRPVRNQGGAEIGRLVDVVCRWTGDETYPPVTGLVVRVGRRLAFVDAVGHRDHRAHPGAAQDGPARPDRLRPPPRRGDPRRPGARPPAGRRRRRAGDPGRRPLPGPGVRPVLPGGRGRLRPEPAAAAGPGPLAAHAHPGPGHRLGRHPAVRRDRAGSGPRGAAAHDQRGPRAPPPRRAGRPARGPDAARAPEAARLPHSRGGGRRPRGDGPRGAGLAAPRGGAGPGRRAARRHGARRGGRRPAGPDQRGARRGAWRPCPRTRWPTWSGCSAIPRTRPAGS